MYDWHGRSLDFDQYFQEEVIAQTGLEPVSVKPGRYNDDNLSTQTMIVSFRQLPTRRFRLFGSSSLARLLDKPKIPQQCTVCWDFHSWRKCSRTPRCGRCGKNGHELANCVSPEQCPNCLEPAPANHKDCPLQPRVAREVVQRLDKKQRKAARTIGAKRYRIRYPASALAPTSTPALSASPAVMNGQLMPYSCHVMHQSSLMHGTSCTSEE